MQCIFWKNKKNIYITKIFNTFSSSDFDSVWKGMKVITSYKTPSPALNNWQTIWMSSIAGLKNTIHTPATPLSATPALVLVLQISEDDVRKVFRMNKRRKAPGPDGVTPVCLKSCADQLTPISTQIFNRSLELCEVPSCFKRSTITPIPKKPKMTGLNDYRPVALTSVVMKSFERLVLAYLKDTTGPLLDPLQFAYRANRSVDDAVNMGLYFILQHLDRPGTYMRILFVDISSAFNTIMPDTLQNKLAQLSVPTSICQWITSILTDRQQLLRLGTFLLFCTLPICILLFYYLCPVLPFCCTVKLLSL